MQYDAREATPASGMGSESDSDVKNWKQLSGRKRGRTSGRGAAVGPPVDGALARVDVWPADCDIHGTLTGKVTLAFPYIQGGIVKRANLQTPWHISESVACRAGVSPNV